MKKKQAKQKFLFIFIVYVLIGGFFLQSVGVSVYKIYNIEREKQNFKKQLVELKEKEDELKGTVTKLQDPDYIARYAREKYLYSKDGEIIIRIPD